MLSERERAEIQEAIHKWAQHAPDPHQPVIGFLGSKMMTPAEVDEAIRSGSEEGQDLLEILEHGVRRVGVKSVVERFYAAARMPA
jgi:hypothetical protein